MSRLAAVLLAAVLCRGVFAADPDAQVRATNAQVRVKVALAIPVSATVAGVDPATDAAPAEAKANAVLAAALAKATETDAPAIAAAVYARLVALTATGVDPVALAKLQAEWYERFKATPSSRAWWILRVAKERAERGESVEKLKEAFDATMRAWVEE